MRRSRRVGLEAEGEASSRRLFLLAFDIGHVDIHARDIRAPVRVGESGLELASGRRLLAIHRQLLLPPTFRRL
eukprot:7391480-Prymnesium_polylepis.5